MLDEINIALVTPAVIPYTVYLNVIPWRGQSPGRHFILHDSMYSVINPRLMNDIIYKSKYEPDFMPPISKRILFTPVSRPISGFIHVMRCWCTACAQYSTSPLRFFAQNNVYSVPLSMSFSSIKYRKKKN